ncbi:MAG: hypothetical protein ACYDCH_14585 [Gaiellaceae bacterium]
MSWPVGEAIVLQEVWSERVWAARPMTVVRDDDDLVALWFPRGTQWRAPSTPPHRPHVEDRGTRLAAFVALGVFDDELASRIRREGQRVAACAQRNEAPFCEPWRETWAPDPSWPVPQLPAGWDAAWG